MTKGRNIIIAFLLIIGFSMLIDSQTGTTLVQENRGAFRSIASKSPFDCMIHKLGKITHRKSNKEFLPLLSLFKEQKGFSQDEVMELVKEISKRCTR